MKISKKNEEKYGTYCKKCEEEYKKNMTKKEKYYHIGCPYREIDNEYCEKIETLEKKQY